MIYRQGLQGFTLIEIMTALMLGLMVMAGVISIFLTNQRVYHTDVALGNVQESARIAFEMMAHDIRQAGITGCKSTPKTLRLTNLLNNGPAKNGTTWWANFVKNSLRGYSQGSSADPALAHLRVPQVASTDSIMLMAATGPSASVASHNKDSATITSNESAPSLKGGDVVVICDPDHAILLQLTRVNGNLLTYVANTGTPGNCSQDLAYPSNCTGTGGNYKLRLNAQITRLSAVDWYIGSKTGNDGRTFHSLYRIELQNKGSVKVAPTAHEMVRDVTKMNIQYHASGENVFVDEDKITDWLLVDAVRINLTLESPDRHVSTDAKGNAQPLRHSFAATTSVRNRVTVP